MRHKNNQKGVTLIELLIYMGLLAIVLVVITEMFASILNIKAESESTANTVQDGRFILSRIMHDAKSADNITSPTNIGDTTNNITFVKGGVTYNYALSGTDLVLTTSSPNESNNLNSSDTLISNFTATKIGNVGGKDTVKVQYTVTSLDERQGYQEELTFVTTVGLK